MNATPQLNTALAKTKAEIPVVLANKKVKIPTKTGREISFTYAELEEILSAITPVLSANGLAIAHQMGFVGDRYCLISTLRHESGEQIESLFLLPTDYDDPKNLGTKIGYGRRYNTLCLLDVIVIEPDSQDWSETKRKIAKEIKQEAGLIRKPVDNKSGSILHDMAEVPPTIKPKPQLPESQSDRDLLMKEIDSLCNRKGITPQIGSDILMELYGVKGRSQLSNQQLIGFRDYLNRPSQVLSS